MASVMDSVNQLTELVGQNRMELLLFRLSGRSQRYGINVFKVREVLPCPKLTVMPRLHKFVVGVAHIRGQTLSVIDLAYAIGGRPVQNFDKNFIIIAEYNRSTHAFLVSNVERILNMNWSKIMPPPKGAGHSNYMTAVTEIEGELVEILDVEKILDEISPKEIIVSEDLKVNGKVPTDLKVLVADDSKVALNQVARALENIGVEVIKARDGREAYDLLRVFAANGPIKDSVELVISDVEMPEMDGYTLCASIRQDPTLKDLYVILHTSLSGVFNQSMVKKAGANDFIPKFNPDELAAAVERGIECVESGISGADCIMKNH
ncbi:Chemotaxis protein CheV [Anaerobiospirillum thomasii]|uniref:Chemotaxis protein CheV n=1 Tax=Anaerobiospirillum thomasii TaxID=179995 RepID=A0A2X0X2I4_9GAMM|nr:chemotaxis protein [Anaerobiospirillum thomasii]SPT69484.1 Chemotaxis protein CheV [Anaerobiospirillum thomasii]SPT71961.1 Chemotaxis protein CheV [Anaerobiospirillum thomasii]